MSQEESILFISYTGADEEWAVRAAVELEKAGLSVRLQAWDLLPGQNFVAWMSAQIAAARWTVALYSRAYFASRWCITEWTAALDRGTLLPFRLEEVAPPEALRTLTWVDLFGCPLATAQRRLLDAIDAARTGRAKPPTTPTFPGTAPYGRTRLSAPPPFMRVTRGCVAPSDPVLLAAFELADQEARDRGRGWWLNAPPREEDPVLHAAIEVGQEVADASDRASWLQ